MLSAADDGFETKEVNYLDIECYQKYGYVNLKKFFITIRQITASPYYFMISSFFVSGYSMGSVQGIVFSYTGTLIFRLDFVEW